MTTVHQLQVVGEMHLRLWYVVAGCSCLCTMSSDRYVNVNVLGRCGKSMPSDIHSTHCTVKSHKAGSLSRSDGKLAKDITVWTVVQTVLTATFNSYGDRQISTPHKINTPEPIDKKITTIDYVREGTSYTKFGRNPSTGGFWANGWNITKIIFIYLYLFFWISLQVRPVDGFLHTIAQKMWNHARMCLLGVWTMFLQILGV